jgi:hypothetical protein
VRRDGDARSSGSYAPGREIRICVTEVWILLGRDGPLIHQALRARSNFFVTSRLDETRHDLERSVGFYATRDDDSWIGFAVFALSMVVVTGGWVAATPFT